MSQAEQSAYRHLGLIAVTGADAGEFLRAQLTNDVLRLSPERHLLAAWCDAKGRALTIARVLETEDGYLLIMPAELISAVMPRLRMFVLRSRVELTDVSARYVVAGLRGDDALPAADECRPGHGGHLLGLPGAHAADKRALLVAPADTALPAAALSTEDEAWELAEIDAGLPTLGAATRGLFVPQMLNLHWLLAIDFNKGCYPGQEVIARLHYRGRLTRRTFRMAWRGKPPMPGEAVVDDGGTNQGTVLRAAAGDATDSGRLLAVVRVDALDRPLQTEAGTTLEWLDLPYATPD